MLGANESKYSLRQSNSMKKSLKNDGSNIDLDPDLKKKYEMSPAKYSTMNV